MKIKVGLECNEVIMKIVSQYKITELFTTEYSCYIVKHKALI